MHLQRLAIFLGPLLASAAPLPESADLIMHLGPHNTEEPATITTDHAPALETTDVSKGSKHPFWDWWNKPVTKEGGEPILVPDMKKRATNIASPADEGETISIHLKHDHIINHGHGHTKRGGFHPWDKFGDWWNAADKKDGLDYYVPGSDSDSYSDDEDPLSIHGHWKPGEADKDPISSGKDHFGEGCEYVGSSWKDYDASGCGRND